MSIYIQRLLKVLASTNQNMTDPLLSRGTNQSDDRIDAETALAEGTASQIVIAGSATDEALPMGNGVVTGAMLVLESDVDIQFKLSGTGESAIDLKVPTSGGTARLVADVEFTSVHITVPGATDANIFYAVIGA